MDPNQPQPVPPPTTPPSQPPAPAPVPTGPPQPQPQPVQPVAAQPAYQPQPPAPAAPPYQPVAQPQQPAYGQPATYGYAQPPVRPAKKFPLWAKLVIGFVALLIVGSVGLVLLVNTVLNIQTKKAEELSNKVVNAIQADDSATIISVAGSEFKAASSDAEVKAVVDSISPGLQGEEKITGRAVAKRNNQQIAIFVYTVPTSQGDRYIRVIVQSQNGDWQLLNFQAAETPLSNDPTQIGN